MTNQKPQELPADSVIEEAAEWITQLQSGEIGHEGRQSLRRWLDESPQHSDVFHRMAGILETTSLLHEDTSPDTDGPPRETVDARQTWFGLPRLVGASAIASVLLVAVFLYSQLHVDHQTGVGEQRRVVLDDGSVIHLNAMTAINVDYTSSQRSLELIDGEALFTVTPDTARPFVVRSKSISITVTGTSFNVNAYEQQARVAVLEGEISVTAERSPGRARTSGGDIDREQSRLRSGQQISYVDGLLSRPAVVDVERIAAWRDGWIYIEKRPLAELVNELNRQFAGEITIADAGLAEMPVNVVLHLDGRSNTLRRLEQLLPIQIVEPDGSQAVIRRENIP